MKPIPPPTIALPSLRVFIALIMLSLSARAQFALDIQPVSPGAGHLRFTLAPGFYYCLGSASDLLSGFAPASGWMLGNGTVATWPLSYPTAPASGGGQRYILPLPVRERENHRLMA